MRRRWSVRVGRVVWKPTIHPMEDLQYTMCVYTGVRDPREAVAKARSLLSTVEPRRA